MQIFSSFIRRIGIEDEPIPVIRARYKSAKANLPLMYFILCVNMLVVSATHIGRAPLILTHYLPIGLLVLCILRLVYWLSSKAENVSDEHAQKTLDEMLAFASLLSALFVAWSLTLFKFGDDTTRGQICFFIGLTLTAILICLMNVRQIAIVVFVVVVLPTSLFLFNQAQAVYHAIAINLIIALGAIVIVLNRTSGQFKASIENQLQLNLANARIVDIAHNDELTNLASRRYFLEFLGERIAEKPNEQFSLAIFDLNGFKPINDVFGHQAGDQVLRTISSRIAKSLPETSMAARMGGDEFAVLIDNRSPKDAYDLSQALMLAVNKPISLEEGSTVVSAALGIAHFPETAVDAFSLFECADHALCHAKQEKIMEPVVFNEEHEQRIIKASKLIKCLREADLEAEVGVVFQPIWDFTESRIVGFEALARWISPTIGDVSPDRFITAAEQAGLVRRLTRVIVNKAIDEAKNWPEQVKLGINLSTIDICSYDAVSSFIQTLEQRKFSSTRITIEVTETAVMQDFERAVASLLKLKRSGVQVALDDFGTGNSSLSYLQKLPLDHVKIDKSFIDNISNDKQAYAIVQTIVSLCKTLGMTCVAEGVESMDQVKELLCIGCNKMQGYYFAKPMSAAETLDFIENSDRATETLVGADRR